MENMIINKKTAIAILFSIFYMMSLTGREVPFIRNTIKEIDNREGKIELKPVRTWGGDDVEDENQFFRLPEDFKIGRDGLVYIVDSGNHRIQVFDRSGKYIRTIGRRGSGPADLYLPNSLDIDRNNNIWVSDSWNYRIQEFDSNGKCLAIFRLKNKRNPSSIAVNSRNEIMVYSHAHTFATGYWIAIYNFKGELLDQFGKNYRKTNSIFNTGSISFAIDLKDNIFIAYYGDPFFWKYSSTGKLLAVVAYDIQGKTIQPIDNGYRTVGSLASNASSGISIDKVGRIYIATCTRAPKEEEKFFLVGDHVAGKKINTDKTDRFRLLVFNPVGKVIAAKRLTVFCDSIYVHDDRLFIIDSYMGMKIHEFKVSFIGNQ